MTVLPVSGRRLLALSILLALVFVPTALHSYGTYRVPVSGLSPVVLPEAVEGSVGVDVERHATWAKDAFDADVWLERRYDLSSGPVTVFLVRGYDLKKIYHHPEIAVLRGRSLERARTGEIEGEPVYVLRNLTDGESMVYALIYDGDWVGSPLRLQVYSALTSLWRGRRPVTLVAVYGDVLGERGDVLQVPATLLQAVVKRSAQIDPGAL